MIRLCPVCRKTVSQTTLGNICGHVDGIGKLCPGQGLSYDLAVDGGLAPCGTRAAYARHYRNREKPCWKCKLAAAKYRNEQYIPRPRKPLRPHGTMAAYLRHKKRGEKPCTQCAQASLEYGRNRRARGKTCQNM